MRLADEKKMTVQECRRKVTSSEFIDWLVYYEQKAREEMERPSKEDHYAALIAWRVQTVLEVLCDVPKGSRSSLKDMLLKFDGGADAVKPKKTWVNPYKVKPGEVPGIEIGKTPLTLEQQIAADRNKMAWLAAFGPPQEAS